MKNTKKLLSVVAIALLAVFVLSACGTQKKDTAVEGKLIIGASPTPHAEILEHVKEKFEEETGWKLEIKIFDDYVLPNKALQDGSITANFFQHIPYLELQEKENGYKFENAGAIHLEPIGLYSKQIKDIKDLKDGSTIICSNSQSDWGRVITILKDAGLVDVKSGVKLENATFEDITKNTKNLKFKYDINPEVLTTVYNNNEATLVAINSNFALKAGLNPMKDAVLRESDNSPYVNIIVTDEKNKNNTQIKKLVELLHEKDVQYWILGKWKGSVKPVPADSK